MDFYERRKMQQGIDTGRGLLLVFIIVPVLVFVKWMIIMLFFPRSIGQIGEVYGFVVMLLLLFYMMGFLIKGVLRGFRAFLYRSNWTLNLCRITLLVSFAVVCSIFLFSYFHNQAPFYEKGPAGTMKNAFRVVRDNATMVSILPLSLSDQEKKLVAESLSKYSDPAAFAASNIAVSQKMEKKNKWSKPVKKEVATKTAAGAAVFKAGSRIIDLVRVTAEVALCVFFICLVKLLYYGHWWRAAFKYAFQAVHVSYFRNVLEIAFTSGGRERIQNILAAVQAGCEEELAEQRAELISAHPELAEIMNEAIAAAEAANRSVKDMR